MWCPLKDHSVRPHSARGVTGVSPPRGRGPNIGGEDLGNRVTFSQTRLATPIAGTAVHAVPADRDYYSQHVALAVVVPVPSKDSNARKNGRDRKSEPEQHFSRQWWSWRQSNLKVEDLQAYWPPFILAAFKTTCVRSPSTLAARPVMFDAPADMRVLCARRMWSASQI